MDFKEQCKHITEIYREFLEKYHYESVDAGIYGWLLIIGNNNKPDSFTTFADPQEFLNYIDRMWMFEMLFRQVELGNLNDNVLERENLEEFLTDELLKERSQLKERCLIH